MARRKTHPEIDFSVDDAAGDERIFKTFDEAVGFAVALAVNTGRPHDVNVLIWDDRGAKWYSGDWAVEQYEDDPDVSIFERTEIHASSQGAVP